MLRSLTSALTVFLLIVCFHGASHADKCKTLNISTDVVLDVFQEIFPVARNTKWVHAAPRPCAERGWDYINVPLQDDARNNGVYWSLTMEGDSPENVYSIRMTVSCGPLVFLQHASLRKSAFWFAQVMEQRLAGIKPVHSFYSDWKSVLDKETEQIINGLLIVRKMAKSDRFQKEPSYRFFWMIRPTNKLDSMSEKTFMGWLLK